MTLFEAIILGIVQGLTEFLPVSSSGHLELGKAILGDTSIPQESMMFTVVVHFATALATLVVYRSEVARIAGGLIQRKNNEEFKFSLKILISMLPAAAIGAGPDAGSASRNETVRATSRSPKGAGAGPP